MHLIENERFAVTIATRGAELRSVKEKGSGRELMWDADPAVWEGSAPILFPFVGTLPNGRTVINGKEYEMQMHGLVRTRDAEVVQLDTGRIVFAFRSDEETLAQYPFAFELQVTFRLEADGLCVEYRVINAGSEEMLFSIGSHPGLALDPEQFSCGAYGIEFEKPETVDLYGMSNKKFTCKQKNYLNGGDHIPLTPTLFDDGFMLFPDIESEHVRITTESSSLKVELGGAPHLAFWAKPGAAYICIEPWYSYDPLPGADGAFENRPGMMRLPAGETFKTGYALRVDG